ncbi:IclR family transcriptional regulator [Blastococcus sp. SYSU D00669]
MTDADDQPGLHGSQLLVRGLRVLEAVATHGGPIGVAELARMLGLPKSTVQRILRTLHELGWVEPSSDPVTRWRLGDRLLAISRTLPRKRDIRQAALPHMPELSRQTQETVHLSVPDLRILGTVLIERVDSPLPLRTFNAIGTSAPLHANASGLAVLAALPDEEVERLLGADLEKVTPNTMVDRQALRERIARIREEGHAVTTAEWREGICGIGAAVVVDLGHPVAGIAISMPQTRFSPDRVGEWGRWVREAADLTVRDFDAA